MAPVLRKKKKSIYSPVPQLQSIDKRGCIDHPKQNNSFQTADTLSPIYKQTVEVSVILHLNHGSMQ